MIITEMIMNLPLNLRLAAGLRVFACIRYALLNNLEQKFGLNTFNIKFEICFKACAFHFKIFSKYLYSLDKTLLCIVEPD